MLMSLICMVLVLLLLVTVTVCEPAEECSGKLPKFSTSGKSVVIWQQKV